MYIHTLTSTFIADCICSHKNAMLAQAIITSHTIYCITQQQPSNILIYFNLIILLNCNFNSVNFNNSCILARHKFWKLPEDDKEMLKCVGVNITWRDSVVIYICALVGWNKKTDNIICVESRVCVQCKVTLSKRRWCCSVNWSHRIMNHLKLSSATAEAQVNIVTT